MVSRSDPTHEYAGEEGGSTDNRSDIQKIKIEGGDYVLVSAEKYQKLLDKLESLDTALEVQRTRIDASKPAPANDTATRTTPEIGAIESTGEHKGEIYGGIFPADNKPIWILEEPEPMTHYDAVELKGRALPTSKEGKYIDTIKDNGTLKDIFARHSDSSSSAGYFWLAEHGSSDARFQQFSDGRQINNHYDNYDGRTACLSVLSVRR